jgi:hypothetical protein
LLAFCHIGFLFYRLIDIGFLTVGFFRSAFDLESSNKYLIYFGLFPSKELHFLAAKNYMALFKKGIEWQVILIARRASKIAF